MHYQGYILSSAPDHPLLVHGVNEEEPFDISAFNWALTYGSMHSPFPHVVGPGQHFIPVRIQDNGVVELFEAVSPGVPSEFNAPIKTMTAREIYAANSQTFPYPEAAFEAGEYDMVLEGKVSDWKEFEDSFNLDDDHLTIGTNFVKTMFPETYGHLPAEIVGAQFRARGDDFSLTLNVRIDDPDFFLMIACHGGRKSGRDIDYIPDNIGDAIFEVYCGSQDTPTPVDCGFEFVSWGGEPENIIKADAPEEDFQP